MHEKPWLPSDKPQEQVAIEDLVRPWVSGMKALVLSNRTDPELEMRLSKKLGLDITWAICDVRRAQAQAKAIASRRYDIVIGQTGFLPHKIEAIIAPACQSYGVPYIRADKARPTATARALIRDLGLDITKEPPKSKRIMVSAPPQQSSDGKIRRRTIVTLPQKPEDYKDLDIDILKFLEKQDSYFRMEDLLRTLPGIPVITGADGKINYGRMRTWTTSVSSVLQKLNYVNAQIPQSIDPARPRVWVRRDRQQLLMGSGRGSADRTPAEVARSQPPVGFRPPDADPQRKSKLADWGRFSTANAQPKLVVKTRAAPTRGIGDKKWLQKYERALRSYARDRMYVHPEDVLRNVLGLDLPPTRSIVWQNYMFWTKNIAPILRKMGFTPRQREFDGHKTRTWIHTNAPRGFHVGPPGQEHTAPEAKRASKPRRAQQTPTPQPQPVAGASSLRPHVFPTSSGPKSVRLSFSSISGGDMQELVLLLTQAGWSVSFGP